MKPITLTEKQMAEAVARWCEIHYLVNDETIRVKISFEVKHLRTDKPVFNAHVREDK